MRNEMRNETRNRHGIVTTARKIEDVETSIMGLFPVSEPKRGSVIRMVPMNPEIKRLLGNTKITTTEPGLLCPSRDFLSGQKVIELPTSMYIPVPAILQGLSRRIASIGFR